MQKNMDLMSKIGGLAMDYLARAYNEGKITLAAAEIARLHGLCPWLFYEDNEDEDQTKIELLLCEVALVGEPCACYTIASWYEKGLKSKHSKVQLLKKAFVEMKESSVDTLRSWFKDGLEEVECEEWIIEPDLNKSIQFYAMAKMFGHGRADESLTKIEAKL